MTKFKSASTTFEFMGVINIKRGLTLTYLGNDFRKDKFYYELIDCVKNAMKNASNEKMNKRARISSEEIRHWLSWKVKIIYTLTINVIN